MVRVVNSVKDIKWDDLNHPLKDSDLPKLGNFPFTLPDELIKLLKINDGGSVDYVFDYYDLHFKETMIGSIGAIYGISTEPSKIPRRNYNPLDINYKPLDIEQYYQEPFYYSYNDIINQYNKPPELFPQNLVAFGENGGGNRICFDYRADPVTDNPPVVYWLKGYEEGEDVSFLADNFVEFLKILKEPEPYFSDKE